MTKIISAICKFFSITVFCYLVAVMCVIMYFNAPNSYHREDKRIIIQSGMTLRQVVETLYKEQVIKNPTAFLYISQLIKGIDPKVRYGEYFFEKNISYYKILHKLTKGYIYFRKITIAEGLSTHTALSIVDHAPGIVGQLPQDIKEGTLLPETYFYSFNDTRLATIKRMQIAMNKTIDDLWEKRDKTTPVKSKREAIILASIVEKETGIAAERPMVASVFVNRLNKGMKLQSDPTIIYSFTFGDKKLERPIRVSDIQNRSAFNTYNIFGLPPAPICNPGAASIKAVLNPPKTDYLYFVASGRGDHIFANSIAEHNKNVAKYRSYLQNKENNVINSSNPS